VNFFLVETHDKKGKENPIEDLMADLVAIIYSFSARMYGQRRAKSQTEKIVEELQAEKIQTEAPSSEGTPQAKNEKK